MSKRFWALRQRLGEWRQQQRAGRQQLRQRQRERNRLLWGGPVEAGRVLAFSDAVFAIAITLLTLNLEVRPGLHGAEFTRTLRQVLPALGAYVLSFVILGQLWLAHHRIFGVVDRVDYAVLVRNLMFLGLIAIMPFPVRLLSDYARRPLAVAVYGVGSAHPVTAGRRSAHQLAIVLGQALTRLLAGTRPTVPGGRRPGFRSRTSG
jgi:hypothetical protein